MHSIFNSMRSPQEQDLKQYMDACVAPMDMMVVNLFLYQLLRGLEFCHSRKVLHRDLKPQVFNPLL